MRCLASHQGSLLKTLKACGVCWPRSTIRIRVANLTPREWLQSTSRVTRWGTLRNGRNTTGDRRNVLLRQLPMQQPRSRLHKPAPLVSSGNPQLLLPELPVTHSAGEHSVRDQRKDRPGILHPRDRRLHRDPPLRRGHQQPRERRRPGDLRDHRNSEHPRSHHQRDHRHGAPPRCLDRSNGFAPP